MRFEFVAKHRGIWPVSWICEALGVSRSGFHAWLVRAPSARARSDEAFGARVRASFISSYRTYGARRVWHDLLAEGLSCGLHRIERLMRVQGLRARPRRRGLPKDDGLRSLIAANLLDRQFTAEAPNQRWIADFTYIWTAEGWLYVAVVIDLFSRRVVGWSMSDTMTAQLVTDALMMAILQRGKLDALLHHSDRGGAAQGSGDAQHCWNGCGGADIRTGIPAADGRQWRDLLDEPVGQRLGQRGDGELLLLAEDRTDRAQNLPHAQSGKPGRVRLHRTLLQSHAQALDFGLS